VVLDELDELALLDELPPPQLPDGAGWHAHVLVLHQ
jgi:hypothetical protein